MKSPGNGDAPRDVDTSPSFSARVRLEVELLAADPVVPARAAPTASEADAHEPSTVLVVARDADMRRYVHECLRDRPGLRVLEVATAPAAFAAVAREHPDLLVVVAPEAAVLASLTDHRALLICDDYPPTSASLGTEHRVLVGPFTAHELVETVGRILSEGDGFD